MARHSFLILFLAAFTVARALVVDCRPGQLESLAGNEAWKQTELTLTGTADASDLFFIADNMPSLKKLDISRLDIVAYSGEKLKGDTRYPASALPTGIFAGMRLEAADLPGGLDIGDMAFAQTRIAEVRLPASTRRVGLGAFAGALVKKATLAAGAEYDTDIFNDCRLLEEVDLGGLTALPDAFFKNCQSLSRVDGAASLTEIGAAAFDNCCRLSDFNFGSALSRIGEKAFLSSGIERADMSACSFERVPRFAFMGCSSLKSAVFPESCRLTDDYSFANALLHGGQRFGAVERIGRYSFASDVLMSSFALPQTLTEICDGAFSGLRSIENIDAVSLTSVPLLGEDVFGDTDRQKVNLYVDINMMDAFADAPVWQDFNIIPGDENGISLPSAAHATLRGRIDGESILLATENAVIEHAELFDASGLLLRTYKPGSTTFAIPAGDFRKGTVLIVSARLSDGSAHSLKFAL